MAITLHGKVRGKTIELTEDPGLADGQEVEISVRTVGTSKPGTGLLRTEGALADEPYWDAVMDGLHRERQNDTRRETAE